MHPSPSTPSRLARILASPWVSWGMVFLGFSLLQAAHVPPFLNLAETFLQPGSPAPWPMLGLGFAISSLPVLGLWRLAGHLGLVRGVAFLFLFFPLATTAFFLVLTLLRRFRRSASSSTEIP